MDFLKKIYFEIRYFLKTIKPEKPLILMYHRIAEDTDDPHLLCVSRKNFREQMEYLKKVKKIIPLKDMKRPDADKNSVAITFDDGYADNLYNALSILEEFNIPVTVFVTAGLLGQKFPWDNENASAKAMTKEELLELSENPLVEIGAHTMTHPYLSTLSEEEQREEIERSKETIESIIGKEVQSFAYPYGDFNEVSLESVKKSDFKRACAVRAEVIDKRTDIFKLPRFIVRDWEIKKFQRKLAVFK